jgi:hypothetical protein
MTDQHEAGARRAPTDIWVVAAVVNRVASILPIFFGRAAGIFNTDTFDIKQGVELVWREADGTPQNDLRRAIRSELPAVRRQADDSGTPATGAVRSAISGIEVLIDEAVTPRTRFQAALAAAVGVALEFDDLGIPAPDGHPSWTVFELRGQAELVESVAAASESPLADVIFSLRMSSGAASMTYRRAMKDLLAARA